MIFTPIPFLLAFSTLPAPRVDCPAPNVRWVEARTASLLAGACHYGAEATTSGREALIAWHVESGVHAGVDLSGVDLAAVIAAEKNLADPRAARASVLYVSDRASAEQRVAAEALARRDLADVLGRVVEVAVVPLSVAFEGERYRVDGGALFGLEGALLADRACCKMPAALWYRPLAPMAKPIVGSNEVFRYADARLGRAWERHDENAAFAEARAE